MILPYIDADKIAEAIEARRHGANDDRIAAYLRCRVEDLPQLLGLPVKSSKPAQSTEIDLWAADKLQEVL